MCSNPLPRCCYCPFYPLQFKDMADPCIPANRTVKPNWSPIFKEQDGLTDDEKLTPAIMKKARKTGVLNMANRGLSKIPECTYLLNDSDTKEVTLESLCVKEEDAWWNQQPMTCLDLSSNQISCISPKIQFLNTLTTLTLHDNNISKIPRAIEYLEKLTRLNLCRNKIQELPDEFFRLKELRYLNLSHNQLSCLHPDISDLNYLEILDISYNKICGIPGGIGFLVKLTELYASNNEISDVPPDITSLRNLTQLDLMCNKISELPEGLGQLRKLKFLYIRNNKIHQFPDIAGCECLVELHAGLNCFSKIPKDICVRLPHLQYLDLSCNKIKEIPDEIVNLQSLARFDISNNCVTNLPTCLARLPNLIGLQVEGNPIKTIRSDILLRGTSRILQTLRERFTDQGEEDMAGQINWGVPGLSNDVFPDKYKMRKTNVLAVSKQNLDNAPDELFRIANEERVRLVDFSRNRFTTLPDGLEYMKESVAELNFANNLIRSIPPFISRLKYLNMINLSCNYLTDLPAGFSELEMLRELNLNNNKFEEIPACVYKCPALQILLISDNRLERIDASPEGLGAMKSLCTLDLRNNNIDQVPPVLGNLRNITTLELLGNTFRLPRHQILTKGTEAIMSYLRDRIPA